VTRKRRKLDFYPTAGWAADVLWRRLPLSVVDNRGSTWAEPCVGAGDLIRPIAGPPRWTNDVDPEREATFHGNAAAVSWWQDTPPPPVDWVVTNPPFSQAMGILRHAYEHARVGVAFLLRASFLEPTKRRSGWFQLHQPTRVIVLPRISFTGDGHTDNVTCCWMIWCKVPGVVEPGVEVVHPSEKAAA
jgi:hypothetical protein